MANATAKQISQLPKKNALRKELWWIVTIKALLLFLLWFCFIRPYEVPVSNTVLAHHVTQSSKYNRRL